MLFKVNADNFVILSLRLLFDQLPNNATNLIINFGYFAKVTLVVILRSDKKHKNSNIPSLNSL